MYFCHITNTYSKLGDKINKITVETRHQTYTNWDREKEEEWTSTGTEIVREINATQAGVELWNSWSKEEQESFIKRLNSNSFPKSTGTRSGHKESGNV